MAETGPAIDREAIATLLEMVGDDAEFLAELIDTYLADAPEQLEQMRVAAATGDAEAMVRPAHTLKANSRNLGAHRLADVCLALESAGRRGETDGTAELVADAGAAFDEARGALLRIRDG